MRKLLILASIASMAAPALTVVVVPAEASASARGCRNVGTAVGGVTGAVVGSNLASGGGRTGGAILGGLVGAVAGHEIAKQNCGGDQRRSYRTASCRNETRYRNHRPYQVHLCQGRDGVWRPA
ncbi:MAG: glycine zipper protein [Caulobacteraceae bacterium]|nr:glycine zipper protein [Caulobacteraceae bacterium]